MKTRTGILALNIAHFFDHYVLLIFPTAVIAIEREWSLSYGEALALGTPAFAAFALGTLPAGWLGDRLDRFLLIALFFVGAGLSCVLTSFASGPASLMVGLGLLGLFAAIYHPVGLALLTDIADRPGRALGVNGVWGNMGLAGGTLVTGLLAQAGGWRLAFLVPGVASVLLGLLLLRMRQAAPGAVRKTRAAPKVARPRAEQRRVIAFLLASALLAGLVFNGLTISLPKVFEERLAGLAGDIGAVGRWTGLVFALAAFAQLPVGRALDRFGPRPILLGLLPIQVAALMAIAGATGAAMVPLAIVLMLLVFAEVPVTGWLLGRYIGNEWRARAFSVQYVLSLGTGAAIIPLMALFHAHDIGFDSQYRMLGIAAALVLVAALLLLPGGRRSAAVLPVTGTQ